MFIKLKALISKMLPGPGLARNITLLVGGTAGAQGLVILSAPIITRLYDPGHFGLLAAYSALLSIFGVIDTLRYELAIPLPEEDKSAANLVAICIISNAFYTILTSVIIYLYKTEIALFMKLPELADYLWLLPLGILLSGTYKTFSYWAIRKKSFKVVASTRIKQSIATGFIQVLAYKLQGLGLLLGQACSHAVGMFQLGKTFFSDCGFSQVNKTDLKETAVRYKDFPLYSTWGALFNTAGVQLPPLLFTILFNPAVAGLYTLANRVLSLPMNLVGTAIGQVFFAEAPQANREDRLGQLVLKLHNTLASFGMAPCLALIIAGPQLFSLVFGENWIQAGEFARYMAPWLYLGFVTSPLSTVFIILEKQGQTMLFQFILVSSRAAAIYFGSLSGNIEQTVLAFAAVSAVIWLGQLFWIAILIKIKLSKILTPTLKTLLSTFLLMLPLIFFIHFYNSHKFSWLFGLVITGIFVIFDYFKKIKKIRKRKTGIPC